MLTRLYVDNYKCLVNFDLRLGKQHLFMGKNGTGKTTVFEVLGMLHRFARPEPVDEVLPESTLTRWQSRKVQTFLIEALLEQYHFRYELVVEQGPFGAVVKSERLFADDTALFSRERDEVKLHEFASANVTVAIPATGAAIGAMPERFTSPRHERFKQWLSRVMVVRADPRRMVSRSDKEETALREDLANFASWFRHVAQEQLGQVAALNKALAHVLDGFDSLRLQSGGEAIRFLRSQWRLDEGSTKRTVEYGFEELSEGQRALIGLYALLYFLRDSGATLCLDEPDNFVALREVQPLMLELRDQERLQSLVISHHPEIINLLAPESGLMFDRAAGGPVRVEPFHAPPDAALAPAELVARGWEDGK